MYTSKQAQEAAVLGLVSLVSTGIAYVVLPNWAFIVGLLWVFREAYFKPTIREPLPIPELAQHMDDDIGPVTDKQRRTCVVTGASGFLARHLIDYLVETNAYDEIRAVDIIEPQYKYSQVVSVVADISDEQAVVKFIRGAGVVFHVASLIDLRDHKYRRHRLYDVNVTGATHIINACIRLGVERLVYTSSFATVVGPQQVEDVNAHSLSWNEDSFEHAMPNDLPAYYAKTKRMAELRLFTANGRGRLRTIALRPCVPFGPGDKLQTHRVAYEWFIAHTTDRSKVNVQSSFVYCKNWALWHKLAADKLLEIPGQIAGKAYFIDNGDDAIVSFKYYRDGIVKRRTKNPPRFEMFIGWYMQRSFYLFNAFFDWYTAGYARGDIFMLNQLAIFYTEVEAKLDCTRLAKLIGYKQLYTMEQAFDDIKKELDI